MMTPVAAKFYSPSAPSGGASFCKRSDQNSASFPEEEGTALSAPRGVSLLSCDITNFAIVIISHTTHKTEGSP